jgi:hypothetical protein
MIKSVFLEWGVTISTVPTLFVLSIFSSNSLKQGEFGNRKVVIDCKEVIRGLEPGPNGYQQEF